MTALSRQQMETWIVSRRAYNLVAFYGIIFTIFWLWFTSLERTSQGAYQPRRAQQQSVSSQNSASRPLSQQVHEYGHDTSSLSGHPFALSTMTCPTILWQLPKDHIPFPFIPPRWTRERTAPVSDDLAQKDTNNLDDSIHDPKYEQHPPEEKWSTRTHTCTSIESLSPLFSIHHCISMSHCAQGYFSIKRLYGCPASSAGDIGSSDHPKLSPSPEHARHFLQNVGPDGFHAVFLGDREQYAIRQKQYVGDCETILHFHMAMPGPGDWMIFHEYSSWNHVNEASHMAWPPFLGTKISNWTSHVCPLCTYDMMHHYTPRETLPACNMGDEHQPLRGSFIRRESSGVIQGDDSFEWVPYGCRLVHPVSVSSAVKVLKTTFDDTASQPHAFNNSMTDDNSQHQEDFNVPAMEHSTISEGKDVKAADEDDVPIEEMSILLIGDSFVRSLMEALIQNIVNVGGRDVLRRKNSTSWLGTSRKPLRYTNKTIVFDVQRRLDGGRVRIRLQYQFDPLLYHLGNMTTSAHPSAALSSQHLQAYPNRHQPSQRFSYKAGILGPEVPSFLPSLQEHQFDVILFSPGHWPASGKPTGGHWTTDQLLAQLKSVIDSLKEYERLRAEEHERQQKEEHRYYHYFSRMYGGSPSNDPPASVSSSLSKRAKKEQYRTFQTLFLGVPASRPHTDLLVKESEDWRNNYRLAYWSSLAERLMAHHGISTLDSFGIVLPDANMANEGIRTISREVSDAIATAVIHFLNI